MKKQKPKTWEQRITIRPRPPRGYQVLQDGQPILFQWLKRHAVKFRRELIAKMRASEGK